MLSRASHLLAAVATLLVASSSYAVTVDFSAYTIRGTPTITENGAGDGFAASTPSPGDKVGYGTSALNGQKLNTFSAVNFTAVVPATPIPYINFWVHDTANPANYAVIATSTNNYNVGNNVGTVVGWKVFEYSPYNTNLSWLFDSGVGSEGSAQYVKRNGSDVSLSAFSDRVVLGGPLPGSGYGTGAPNPGYGFNIVYGDTLANYVGAATISGLTITANGQTFEAGVVPLPPAALGGIALLGSRFFGRRRSAQA
jgi:hypothetical protein